MEIDGSAEKSFCVRSRPGGKAFGVGTTHFDSDTTGTDTVVIALHLLEDKLLASAATARNPRTARIDAWRA